MVASRKSWTKRAARASSRWLYWVHRWVGVGACLFFAMWFLSGLVMMYVPYPAYTQDERLAHLPAIEWSKVNVAPSAALAAAGAKSYPQELRLEMAGLDPVWRINADGKRSVISAVDGAQAGGVAEWRAHQIGQAYDPVLRPTLIRLLERDQWTVAQGYNRARPMYLYDLHDGKGGRLYVSKTLGEVVLQTTGQERFWNWLGSVPHWLYPTVVRQFPQGWRQVVMWFSGIAAISAFTGLWVGVLRMRIRNRRHHPISPYRGWMKWHHWAGLIGGVFLTIWIVTGWWSVNPFRWFDTPSPPDAGLSAYAGHAGADMPADLAALSKAAPGARQVNFYWLQSKPFAAIDGDTKVLDPTTGAPAPLTDGELFTAARQIVAAPVTSAVRQTADDNYWYTHHEKHLLPVLRVSYADPHQSWIYLDPTTGEVLDISNASSRAYRWVFAGAHQLDFRFLDHHRPVWDIVMWLLLLAGTITSISGIVIGWRRLRRQVEIA